MYTPFVVTHMHCECHSALKVCTISLLTINLAVFFANVQPHAFCGLLTAGSGLRTGLTNTPFCCTSYPLLAQPHIHLL